jgi:hypothetical protein
MDGTPKTEPATSPVMGARRPVAAVRAGRGRNGGSTVSDLLIQLGRVEGREIVIADGDLRNSTLARFYPPGTPGGALQPASDDLYDMKEFFTSALGKAIEAGASLVADFGGGDRFLQEYGRELALVEMCESVGIEPLALYVTGPDPDDFEHVLSIWKAKVFRPRRALLFLNEHLVSHDRSPVGAFDALMRRSEMAEMIAQGVKVIVVPRLSSMIQMREAGLSIFDAMNGRPGTTGAPLDPIRRFMVKHWLGLINRSLVDANVLDWLP